ncbi:MAG: tetratricopeptide repeat protein [Candidatus Gastranaerophilaceae bacterium]
MKKRLFLLATMALFTFPAFANEAADDLFDMARNFYDSGDYYSSYEYATQLLKINPSHFGANYLIIKMTPPEKFLEETNLTSKIIIRPTNVKTGNKASDDYNIKGENCYKQKNYKKAKEYFDIAIRNNPENRYAYNNLGLVYWNIKEYKLSERAFKKANRINEKFTAPLDNLAQMLISVGEFEKAQKYLKDAILKNKNDYCAYYLLGLINKSESNYKDSIRYFNTASQMNPDFYLSYLQLADVYYYTKDYAWSNSALDKYLEKFPNDDYAYFMKHRNYLMLKDYNIAKNYILEAIKLNNCIDYRIALAGVENLLDNSKAAIDALKVIPNPTGEVLNEMGKYYLKLKDNKNALNCFQNAAISKGSRPIYFYNVALVYKNIGDMDNYKKMISALESMEPMIPQDFIDLSGVYLDYAGKNKAIEILNKGIKLYPKDKSIYEAKQRIYSITSDKIGEERTKNEINRIFK